MTCVILYNKCHPKDVVSMDSNFRQLKSSYFPFPFSKNCRDETEIFKGSEYVKETCWRIRRKWLVRACSQSIGFAFHIGSCKKTYKYKIK